MQGLVSIIKGEFANTIKQFWEELENLLGFKPVNPLIPHFSWFGAENFPVSELKSIIDKNSDIKVNLKVKCGGISIFPSEELIIYIPIVVSERLIKVHSELYNKLIVPIETNILNNNYYYFPNNWVPHITLVQNNHFKELPTNILKKILEMNDYYEFEVGNLSLIDTKGKIFFEL